jgi:hypothetical protein
VVGDELLDLAEVLAERGGSPRRLGRRRRHAGQLAHGREGKLATGERGGELRQRPEGARDAQPVLGGARCVAEHALEVVERGHHPERAPDLEHLGLT